MRAPFWRFLADEGRMEAHIRIDQTATNTSPNISTGRSTRNRPNADRIVSISAFDSRNAASSSNVENDTAPLYSLKGKGWLTPPQWCSRRQMGLPSAALLGNPTVGPGYATPPTSSHSNTPSRICVAESAGPGYVQWCLVIRCGRQPFSRDGSVVSIDA
jgi:hypothetical protein